MGIKIVREESETPNIRNTDDFVSIRYAYGNQNGYVISKGNELDITQVDAKNINIGSGRLVVQGVEVDIDANGVNVAFDDLSQTGDVYVSVYCKVNVALNEVVVEKMFDMVDYPVIEEGDDLTEKSSGIANIEIAHIKLSNGAIVSINKTIKPIEYSLVITKDENGVLMVGDTIIPQKKILWEIPQDPMDSNNNTWNISLAQQYAEIPYADIFKNKTLEIIVTSEYGKFPCKIIDSFSRNIDGRVIKGIIPLGWYFSKNILGDTVFGNREIRIYLENDILNVERFYSNSIGIDGKSGEVAFSKIYEIIE